MLNVMSVASMYNYCKGGNAGIRVDTSTLHCFDTSRLTHSAADVASMLLRLSALCFDPSGCSLYGAQWNKNGYKWASPVYADKLLSMAVGLGLGTFVTKSNGLRVVTHNGTPYVRLDHAAIRAEVHKAEVKTEAEMQWSQPVGGSDAKG